MHSTYTRTVALFFLTTSVYIRPTAGALDQTFGSAGTGIATTAIGRSNTLTSIAIQNDDTIIGVGTVTVMATASGICSFSANGSLNTTFNQVGYQQLIIGASTVLQAIALQSDGLAVVGGYAMENGITKFALARYDMTGTLDQSFGGTGYVTTNIKGGSAIHALCIQPDGKILAAGVAGEGTPTFAIARYNTDGSLDNTFGNYGVTTTNPGFTSTIHSLALQPDGKILAAGYCWNDWRDTFALARFNPDGTLDETFGSAGKVTTPVGHTSQANKLVLQNDGNIVLAGFTTEDYIHYSFALARYDTNGALDLSFNNGGIVITELNYSSKINALTIQPDGNIIVGGYNFGARNTNFALARYLPSGLLDQTFGTQGITLTSVGMNAQINSLALQQNGNIIAAGTSDDSAAMARYFVA